MTLRRGKAEPDSEPAQPDEVGFQPKVYNTDEIFSKLRQVETSGIPLDQEKIKLMVVSAVQIIVVTDQDKVFRLKEEAGETVFTQYEVPEKKAENANKELLGNIKDVGKKILFLGGNNTKISIDRIFLDPKGNHCVLSSDKGFNFYLNYEHNRIKVLKNLRGTDFVIKSIGWDDYGSSITSTKNMILGTLEGGLYLYKVEVGKGQEIIEANPEQLTQLRGGKPILSLDILHIGSEPSFEDKKIIVLASTSTSIFSFYGKELSTMFQAYKTAESQQEAGLDFHTSALVSIMSICYLDVNNFKQPSSFLWSNGTALQYYDIPQDNYTPRYLQETQYYKYAKLIEDAAFEYKVGEMPIDLLLTEFHYFILHSDSLTIMSRISERVVQKYDLKSMGIVYGMCYDYNNRQVYVYSAKQVHRLNINNEHKDAWRLFLEKKDVKQAYEICIRMEQDSAEYLGGLYADQLFEQKKYIEAAGQYFLTLRTFEEITLKFLTEQIKGDPEVVEGLEAYLQLWLKNLKPENEVQRIIIINWLVEIRIRRQCHIEQQINYAQAQTNGSEWAKSKDYLQLEKIAADSDAILKTLLTGPCDVIPDSCESSIYQIIQSHGRLKECLEFAQQKQSYEMIIQHHINEGEYDKALMTLKALPKKKQLLQFLQKFGQILLQKWATETIELMKGVAELLMKKHFRTEKLVIDLMSIPKTHIEAGIDFIQTLLSFSVNEKGDDYIDTLFGQKNKKKDAEYIQRMQNQKYKNKCIHNIQIYFLSNSKNVNKLTSHLKEQDGKNSFDIDFALRLVTSFKVNRQAQIQIYVMMNMNSEAVKLALNQGQIDTAMELAKKTTFKEEESKKLWMEIARYLLNKGGNSIEEVQKIIDSQNQYIRIEDLLLELNDSIKIEHFKDQICDSLQTYNSDIQNLKETMKGYAESADQLKSDLRMIKHRYIEMAPNLNCSECFQNLFQESFYIFPCMHGFHKECLINKMKKQGLEPQRLAAINQLNVELEALQQKQIKAEIRKRQQQGSGFLSNLNQMFGGSRATSEEEDATQAQTLTLNEKELQIQKVKLDQMLASECIYCGPCVIDNIHKRYEEDTLNGDSEWAI